MTSPASPAPDQPGRFLRVQIGINSSSARAAVVSVMPALEEAGVSGADLASWELALTEASVNAVENAIPSNPPKPAWMDLLFHPDAVEVRITDFTPGFDWPETAELPDPLSESGRGLYLIEACVDSVQYLRGQESNCLILVRKHSTPIPPSSQINLDIQSLSQSPNPAPPVAESTANLERVAQLESTVAELETTLGEMTEELGYNYEALVAIFRRSADLGSSLDQEEFASRVVDDLLQITDSNLAVLRLAIKKGSTLRPLIVRSPENIECNLDPLPFNKEDPKVAQTPQTTSSSAYPEPIECNAVRTRHDVWFKAADLQKHLDPLSPVGAWGVGLCHAIYTNDQLLGTLTLGRTQEDQFSAAQVNLLHTFADFLAIQLLNARLQEERLQARLLRRDLEIAANIQETLLPRTLPNCAPFSVAGSCRNALQVGGDLYDVQVVDGDGILFLIADVMGKGIPAALFGAILRSTIRSLPQLHARPAELLAATNRLLAPDLSQVDMFITATCVHLHRPTGNLTFASAGHPPALVRRSAEAPLESVGDAGLPLGVDPSATYESCSLQINSGGWVLLHTDGITETRNRKDEFYGDERLMEWLSNPGNRYKSASEFRSALRDNLDAFRDGTSLPDDETFVVAVHQSR